MPSTHSAKRLHVVEHACWLASHPKIDWSRVRLHEGSRARNTAALSRHGAHGLNTLGVLRQALLPTHRWVESVHVYAAGPPPRTPDPAQAHGILDALGAAVHAAKAGEVLLIELQTQWIDPQNRAGALMPIEIWPGFFHLIRTATDRGILVVEPAGNGGINLDDLPVSTRSVDINHTDSGAVMVGAGHTQQGGAWRRDRTSNHGKRVDLFVSSGTALSTGDVSRYGNTSGAAACAAVRAAEIAAAHPQADPMQLRDRLRQTSPRARTS
ncbi:MAG: hypothetical protein AB8H79_25015 [Myxococcota bacterium]